MTVGELYTPDCAAYLGAARCGVDLTALEESGTVAAVTSATFRDATCAGDRLVRAVARRRVDTAGMLRQLTRISQYITAFARELEGRRR